MYCGDTGTTDIIPVKKRGQYTLYVDSNLSFEKKHKGGFIYDGDEVGNMENQMGEEVMYFEK